MDHPVKITRSEGHSLHIVWDDGTEKDITYKKLRDECPCVNCKGETVIFNSYIPIKDPFKAAGFYEIDSIEKVGNYAIQINWKDGHKTGIYSWDTLKQLSEG